MAQFVNDCFDQDNLRIFESLKELAIEADTENCFISGERRFCHLQDARLSCSPITVYANRYWSF